MKTKTKRRRLTISIIMDWAAPQRAEPSMKTEQANILLRAAMHERNRETKNEKHTEGQLDKLLLVASAIFFYYLDFFFFCAETMVFT